MREQDSWSVSVERNGENVVTIASGCLSGRDLSPEDEACIRDCARHLLAFVALSRSQPAQAESLRIAIVRWARLNNIHATLLRFGRALSVELESHRLQPIETSSGNKPEPIADRAALSRSPVEPIKATLQDIQRRFGIGAGGAMRLAELVEALKELRMNANRLCDRNQGGTYEDDCRRSIARADSALKDATPPAVRAAKGSE